MKTESLSDFLARGGEIKKLPSGVPKTERQERPQGNKNTKFIPVKFRPRKVADAGFSPNKT